MWEKVTKRHHSVNTFFQPSKWEVARIIFPFGDFVGGVDFEILGSQIGAAILAKMDLLFVAWFLLF